ncbi:hypothetical protein [uncultured Treponema sp.]|uniref:hypothetical protein n=1 Tax=uncultured Treponema sp. TaxID=162155 RepID=UPI00258F7AF3|nr:hypothetical protein [uncultured Treponema sp.]
MSKDKNLNIKIKADSKEFDSGIDKVKNKLNAFEKKVSNSAITKLAAGINPLIQSFSLVTSAIKKAVSSISECSDAYEKQANAETLLQAAVKNNPYLNEQSVLQLKEYASHLQSISTVGDEELLPFMAQLAAAGRTQTEIQDIMSAALDVSASGAMSLESAVKNLNKTFSGLSGELGENVPQIKQLTKEQLKNGDAVKILAEQYSGMAKSTAGSTGGWKQFKNTLGDLQEMIGEKFSQNKNAAGQVLNSFFSKVIEKLQAAKKETDEFRIKLGLIAQNDGTDATISSYQSELDLLKKENLEIQKKKNVLSSANWKQYAAAQTAALKQEVEAYESKAAELNKATRDAYNEWLPYSQAVTEEEKTKQAELRKTYQTALHTEQEYLREQQGVKKRLKETTKAMKEEYNDLIEDQEMWTAESLKKDEDANNKRIEFLEQQIAIKKKEEENLKNSSKQDEETAKINAQIAAYNEKIKAMQKEAELRGKSVSQEDLLNAKIEHYMAVWKESGDWAATYLQNLAKEIEKDFSDLNIDIPPMPALDKLSDKEQIEALEGYMQILLSLKDNLEENSGAWNKLEESITGVIGQIELLKNKADGWDAMSSFEKIGYVQEKFSELTSGINSALSLVSETLDNQTSADVQSLENAYKKGLISEEEYYSKKEKIEKDSARKKYKVQMAEWALNLLQTQSAAAVAIANSLKDGGTLGMINAAIMGVATAAQLAAQIAAKPVPPSFASGGIVPGTSYSGDNVQANVNSGEMILNARQQRALWETANGSIGAGAGGVVFNIKVNNEAADVASAGVTSNSDGFTVAIKKIVSDAMANGEMNDSFQVMKANIYGRRITN